MPSLPWQEYNSTPLHQSKLEQEKEKNIITKIQTTSTKILYSPILVKQQQKTPTNQKKGTPKLKQKQIPSNT